MNTNNNVVRVKLSAGAIMPKRCSVGASGYDLYARRRYFVMDGSILFIDTGVSIELIDDTWEAQIRPRSSMSRHGLWVAPGTIDSDYRGNIGVVIKSMGFSGVIDIGQRIAQLVFARVSHPTLLQSTELGDTVRGAGGFGSTGR